MSLNGMIQFEESSEPIPKTPQKTLYAVAYNKKVRCRNGRWRWVPAEIEYVRADSANDARLAVIRANTCQIDVIACAPPVGYFVENEKTMVLSAS